MGVEVLCEVGNLVHTAWCQPCRSAGVCMRFPAVESREDRSMPQPFRALPELTGAQQWVIDSLIPWRAALEAEGITTNHGLGEDADEMMAHPRTAWSLWRRGWIRRSVLSDRPTRDKWMLTDAAWQHLQAPSPMPEAEIENEGTER